jgi:hypothetical protein
MKNEKSWMIVIVAASLGGCGQVGVASGGGVPSETDGSDDGTDENEDAGGDAPDLEPDTCRAVHRERNDPRVVLDADISCNHASYGRLGLSVVASGDAVQLAVSSHDHAWLVRIDPWGGDMTELAGFERQRVLAMLDEAGRLVLAAYDHAAMQEPDSSTICMFAPEGGQMDALVLPGGGAQPVNLASGADGMLTLWASTKEGQWLVVRRNEDSWNVTDANIPVGASRPRFAIDARGNELAVDYVEAEMAGWQLATQIGPLVLRGDVLEERPTAFLPVGRAPVDDDEELPAFAVVTAPSTELRVDWPGASDTQPIIVPQSEARVSPCPLLDDHWECPEDCHDQSEGRDGSAFSAAHGVDGTLWIAHVHSSVDGTFVYGQICDDVKGGCSCQSSFVDEGSTTTLRVSAVRPGVPVETVFEMPIDGGPGTGSPGFRIDLDAQESRLAIAIRSDASTVLDTQQTTIRTVLIDIATDDSVSPRK